MKTRLLALTVLSVIFASGCSTNSAPRVQVQYVDASVNSIDKAPAICSSDNAGRGNPLLGGVVGGVIGNQFGSGKGKIATTLLGITLGVNATKGDTRKGSKLKCASNGYIASVSFIDPQTNRVVTDFVRLAKRTSNKSMNIPVCLYPQGTRTCV